MMDTDGQLVSWDVPLSAQTELTFDLSATQGKLVVNLMAGLAELKHNLLHERLADMIFNISKTDISNTDILYEVRVS